MDILIKNMKMPKGDIPLVLIIASDGTVEEIDDSDEINATDAKAIEIPPHGRLGDLDELFNQVKENPFFLHRFEQNRALRIISAAPIVLEKTK